VKDSVYWWLFHIARWAALYGAFVLHLEGAFYVLAFFVWLMAPLSLMLLTDAVVIHAATNPARPAQRWLGRLQDWATLLPLVWFGHIVTALAWCVVILMIEAHREATDKKRAQASATAA
jgi:hypothetical protein